jgi:hypothetical protein
MRMSARSVFENAPSSTRRSPSLRLAEPVSVRFGPVFQVREPPYVVRVPFQKCPKVSRWCWTMG